MFGNQFRGVIVGAVTTCGACFLTSAPAYAQSLDYRFWIEVSAHRPSIDTDIQISSITSHTIGTEIDAESDLGLKPTKTLPVFKAGARLGRNWLINAEAYPLKREKTHILEREITFEDVTYPISASATLKLNTDVYRLSVGYVLLRTRNIEAGAALGVHATDIKASIEGQGRVGNASARLQRRSRDFLAPLPTVGLFGQVRVLPRVTVNGRVDYLSLTVGNYDGRLINTHVAATYRFLKNAGVSIGYRFVDYRVKVDKESYAGRFDYRFAGPTLGLQLGF